MFLLSDFDVLTSVLFFRYNNSFVSITKRERESDCVSRTRRAIARKIPVKVVEEIFYATTRPLITCHLVCAQKKGWAVDRKNRRPRQPGIELEFIDRKFWLVRARGVTNSDLRERERFISRIRSRLLSLFLSDPLRACVPNDIVEWLNIIPPLDAAERNSVEFSLNFRDRFL